MIAKYAVKHGVNFLSLLLNHSRLQIKKEVGGAGGKKQNAESNEKPQALKIKRREETNG